MEEIIKVKGETRRSLEKDAFSKEQRVIKINNNNKISALFQCLFVSISLFVVNLHLPKFPEHAPLV